MVFGNEGVQFLIFSGLTVMLLATPEFNWRTARQNVIDGLSKSQWFWGKSLLLPVVALAFLGIHILIPGVLALIRTDLGAATGPLVPASVFAATEAWSSPSSASGLLRFCDFRDPPDGCLARDLDSLGRPIESGMLRALVMRYLPDYTDWLDYLPFGHRRPAPGLPELRHGDRRGDGCRSGGGGARCAPAPDLTGHVIAPSPGRSSSSAPPSSGSAAATSEAGDGLRGSGARVA